MTPNLKAAIAAIQPLSLEERQQLLQILNQDASFNTQATELITLSTQFWQGISLTRLFDHQTPRTISNIQDLAIDFWPQEESEEDFLHFLRQQRQETID